MLNSFLIGLVLLTLLLVLLALARPNQKRMPLRMLASLMLVLGLALLVWKSKAPLSKLRAKTLVILTQGYQPNDLKSFKNALQIELANLSQSDIQAADTIHLVGYGLADTSEFDFPKQKLVFHPSPLAPGITAIHWNNHLALGQSLELQGAVVNQEKKPLQLMVLSGNQVLERMEIPAQTSSLFQLHPQPKNLGTGLYQLALVNQKDTLSNSPIPFVVSLPRSMPVLLLQDAPSFEQKFLKNWLSDHGYPLAIRTRISKQLFDQGFANRASTNLLSINSRLLQEFQVLIADQASLNSLSSMEQLQIRSAIKEKGLGLWITSDTMLQQGPIVENAFELKTNVDSSTLSKVLMMPGQDSSWHPSLSKEDHLFIIPTDQQQSIVVDGKGRTKAAIALAGLGKIGYSTIGQTHHWLLAGKEREYDLYWTQLIESVLQLNSLTQQWDIGNGMPFLGEPMILKQFTNPGEPSMGILNTTKCFMQANGAWPFIQTGCFWPSKAGWQELITSNGQMIPWYVFDSKDWLTLQWVNRIAQTKAWLSSPVVPNKYLDQQEDALEQPLLPAIWAWLILLLGWLILWVESKLE